MGVSLTFLGAARHTTGSKHLLATGERSVLLDCGMVQGPRQIANARNRDLGLAPRSLDAVVLSHAHIDHSGSLPRLVKLGYRGPIYCTEGTASLLGVMLADSAKIQTADAEHLRRRGHPVEPIYDAGDVEGTMRQVRAIPYHAEVEVCAGVRARFTDAGHILGSAMVALDVDDEGRRLRVAFTGDHGRKGLPILRDPEPVPEGDWLITESTYGDRKHEPTPDLEARLAGVVNEEVRDDGRILIPAFSIGRTQNVVMFLGQLIAAGRIPHLPIWVDSPLSQQATVVMSRHPELFDAETRAILAAGRSPFFFDGVRYVADVDESRALNDVRQGVIIAASGMCETGRILHHLQRSVGRPEDCVLLVGFQADGTLGRKLLDGWEQVRIFGERHAVRCRVRSMQALSAHADGDELLANSRHLAGKTRGVFVVHGEERAAAAHAERLRDAGFANVAVPVREQEFTL